MANVAPFTFLTTTYNKNIKIMQERLVTKRKQRSDESIVFLNRDFKVGEKLTFRIESADTSPTDQPGISFTFGTTTCDMDKVCNDPCHSFAVCKPGTPCGGRSAVFMIRNCDRVGNHVTFERVPDQEGFVKIMLFRTVIGMRDFKQVFVNNAKAHPFVILDGNVESLRIVNESVLPNVGPMGRRTPGTPSSFPGGNHSNLSFLLPPYRNDSMRLQDNNKTARRVTAGVDGRIVYLNKPLELGVKLIIKIEQVLTQSPIGMVFGVTSCSLQKIRELDCHVLSMCSSSSCNGQSIHFPVQDCQQAGGIIVFERMPRGVIQVTSGANVRNTSFIPFPSAIPFFMLTGCVDAIRIFSDPSSLPNTRVFHKTPPRFTPGNQSGQGQGNQTGSRTGYRGPRRTPTFAKANHSQDEDEEPEITREINIMILGETGVGKSTFINGLVNYLTFETLKEAEESEELVSLIASSFVMSASASTGSMVPMKIETKGIHGNEQNEDLQDGQSATQQAKVYKIDCNTTRLRIIDTPGIGDVRGVDQDKINFENIIETVSSLKELHAILILLRPDKARLNLMFKYCIQDLLSHLHKSAAQNIVFGFTNTRSSFYGPGDTYVPLKLMIDELQNVRIELSTKTMYCFDSESYRFLAAAKQGYPFEERTRTAYADSWMHSVKETERMMKHITSLKPHNVHDMTSLNAARNTIMHLTRPLAEITRLIHTNVNLSKDKVRELQQTQQRGQELSRMLKINRIDLVSKPLGYPRTTCTESSCIEIRIIDGRQKINHVRKCHEHCYLTGVQLECTNNPKLYHCAAMSNGVCNECHHDYKVHIHIQTEMYEVTNEVDDVGIRDQLQENLSDETRKQAAVTIIETRIAEYQKEQREIEQAAAKFGCFLKRNAITPYNDARIEYLNHLIREEKQKAQFSNDNAAIDSLEETKRMYLEEVDLIHRSADDDAFLDPEMISNLVESLYQLKHVGDNLKQLNQVAVKANHAHSEELNFAAPPNKRKTRFWKRLFA